MWEMPRRQGWKWELAVGLEAVCRRIATDRCTSSEIMRVRVDAAQQEQLDSCI